MPRIFKGSESTLRLLISKTGDYQALTGIKIKLYTTDIENAIEIIDGIQVCKNIAIITLAPRAFMGMEDGLINYIIDGATEDDVFHTERQSNYMLKSLSYINEDGVATQKMTIEANGEYRVTPNDGLYVDINVNVSDLNGSYDDGFNVGYGQGKTDGANEQKSKLETINITENGTYTKEDGYNQIEVNVPDLNGSYEQGKTDGVNEQKSKLETINITENGVYSKEDGYNHIEVNVPDLNGSYDEGYEQGHTEGYNEGKTDGVNEQKGKLESINITENGTYTKEDGYNHIEVNVNAVPKINVKEAIIKFGFSTFTKVPEWADFEGITDMENMFNTCIYLQTIPLIDTSNVEKISSMFSNCYNLKTIPALDLRSLSKVSPYEGFFGYNTLTNLTDLEGFLNLKCSLIGDNNLKKLPNLTYESCINVLNGLYDFSGNGETPGSNQGQLKVHQNFLDTVGEEISIGTNKGWTITV